MMMRDISDFEKSLVEGVAQRLPPLEASKLIDDLMLASVDDSSSDPTRIFFVIDGHPHPPYAGQHQYPVEIRLSDVDGADITAVLYANENNNLYELELIRWDGKDISCPNIDSISFY